MGCDTLLYLIVPVNLHISIHAARMGCDYFNLPIGKGFLQFQSTQPEWAATIDADYYNNADNISIHAARMGCDVPYTNA